ncbi:MAG: putative bifunctional diguanylate cyclase/phosphodiesterase [Acidimicrobiales bacterium]
MKRWLVLSPMIGVLVALAIGVGLAIDVGGTRGAGIATGTGITVTAASSVLLLQRSAGRETISKLLASERRARLDPLTGLLNRSGLMETLVESIDSARRDRTCIGVLFSDLDRFKVVNDTLGHDVGDELLVAVAERMQKSVRSSDVVGRFGGDEFVVICRGLLEADSIHRVAETVLASFEEPFEVSDGALVVSPSIGVAVWDPGSGEKVQADHLVRDADTAMYEAKRRRKGVSVFDYEIRRHLLSRLEVEQALSVADASDIVVHYQPVIDARNNVPSGIEALVRWNHPQHGLLFPGQFLSVAEESGLLAGIGETVLREACAQAEMWNQMNPTFRQVGMSVNVAECQILDASFPTRVKNALEWSRLEPAQLCLEISEDLVTEHISGSLPVLEQIAEMGVRLSLDDFGTGKTTLSHLKHLSNVVHQIKIDRSFVTDITSDAIDQAVVEAISRISRTAGLVIVAEGVETPDQAEALLQLGIHHHQGFLYSQGIPADKITDRIIPAEPGFGATAAVLH